MVDDARQPDEKVQDENPVVLIVGEEDWLLRPASRGAVRRIPRLGLPLCTMREGCAGCPHHAILIRLAKRMEPDASRFYITPR